MTHALSVFATRQLHNKDGTVHKHGRRNNPCSGPHKAPLSVGTPGCPASGSTFHTSSSATNSQPTGTAFVATEVSQVSSQSPNSHPTATWLPNHPLIIKHIPNLPDLLVLHICHARWAMLFLIWVMFIAGW